MSNRDSPVGNVVAGAYRLTRAIAEGGMGTVYEAVQIRLNRRFAVKLMSPEAAASPEALARFRREAEVTSQLAHPHVIYVADFGTTERGEPYMVMEFLDGEDLEQRLHRVGRFNLADTVHVIKQVASALSATHAKGIVHRDLKPANVFLLDIEGEPDFVKVVDFGISKLKKASTKLTRPSVLMGTPSYMPPEQATGKADSADHRTDQWALGAVAWEMLSGQPPFVGKDVTTLLHAIANLEPPPLGARVSGLPPDVEAVLRRALAKRPGDRFPTVAAFARSLEAAATEPPAGAGDAGDRGGADASGAGGRAGHPGRTQTRDPRPSRRSAIATFFRSINPQALLAARAAAQERSRSRRRWLVTAAVAIPVVAVAAFFLFFHSGSQSLKGSLGELLGLDPPGASAADPASPSPKGRTRSAGAGDGEGSEGRASRTPRRPRAGSRADVETSPGHR